MVVTLAVDWQEIPQKLIDRPQMADAQVLRSLQDGQPKSIRHIWAITKLKSINVVTNSLNRLENNGFVILQTRTLQYEV